MLKGLNLVLRTLLGLALGVLISTRSRATEARLVRLLNDPNGSPARWMFWLAVAIALFYWKILFTHQFSLLTGYESANQAYAWYHYSASSLQHGVLPLWDPFAHAGRSFAGEMQTALFYPPKFLLYFWPLNRAGLFSPQLFHHFIVLTHFAGACFLFLLARELGLGGWPSFFAGLSFALGGFVGRVIWPNMLDSAIWLPAAMLLLRRALGAPDARRMLAYAAWCGLAHSFSILAGSLHVALMNSIVLAGAAIYFGVQQRQRSKSLMILAVIAGISAAAASFQLLPSIEYSPLAIRFLGGDLAALPAAQRIPYSGMSETFWPRSLLAFFIGGAFLGTSLGTGEVSPYMGVLTILLALIGVWRNWERSWVRFLTVMGGLAFFYSLGAYSLLHGVVYALTPAIWMAREGGRFIYCTHFAMALLAGYGLETVLEQREALIRQWRTIKKILKSLALASAAMLTVPAYYGKLDVNEWSYASFFFVLTSCGALALLIRGGPTSGRRLLLVAVLLSDLSAFDWTVRDVGQEDRQNRNAFAVLLKSRPLVEFLRRQPGLFRVHFAADWEPSIGDVYGIHTTAGKSATMLASYSRLRADGTRALDLLNVRYIIRPATAAEPGPIYQDELWKVYENPTAMPRAWMKGVTAQIDWELHEANRLELRVRSPKQGLLVLSEMDYPGWRAVVNGQDAQIVCVEGALRGVVIAPGESRVVLRYAPWWLGPAAALTLGAWIGCAWLSWLAFRGVSRYIERDEETGDRFSRRAAAGGLS